LASGKNGRPGLVDSCTWGQAAAKSGPIKGGGKNESLEKQYRKRGCRVRAESKAGKVALRKSVAN